MAEATLFGRTATLTIAGPSGHGIEIKDLRFKFDVTKTLKPQPNKAEIKVYNLTSDHRRQLEGLPYAGVSLEAGYKDHASQIFFGNLTNISSVRDGADVLTTLTSGDGSIAIKHARIAKSFGKGSTVEQVLRALALSLGVDAKPGSTFKDIQVKFHGTDFVYSESIKVGPGNLTQAVTLMKAQLGLANAQLFSMGTVLSGNSAREMTKLCRTLGLEWSVQQGKLRILPIGKALEGEAIFLSSANGGTGLVGAPTMDAAQKGKKPQLNCKCLLIPNVEPGRLLVLDSENVKGQFRITEVHTVGDSNSPGGAGDWGHEIKAEKF